MKVSEMKHKIDIVQINNSSGPFGNGEEIAFSSIWAKKEDLVGNQLYQAMGETNKIPCNFIIRRNDNITNDMFVKFKNKLYDIKSAVPLKGNDSFTILSCYEMA